MRSVLFSCVLAAGAGALCVAAPARATFYGWNYTKGQAGEGTQYFRNDTGGTIETISTTFDTTARRLTFDVLFSGANNTPAPLVTNGFWLVLDNGPNPKTHSGELAIVYFDASRVFAGTATTPTMTVYGYNGLDANTSWRDGNGDGVNDSGDLIKGAFETGFIHSESAGTQTIAGQAFRRMSFDIDAADIMSHLPQYPHADTTWQGTGFDTHLGIWFHPAQIFSANYENALGASRGRITSLTTGQEGWLDGANFQTFTIPAPGGATLLGLAGLVAVRRRR